MSSKTTSEFFNKRAGTPPNMVPCDPPYETLTFPPIDFGGAFKKSPVPRGTHPSTAAFFQILEEVKEMHIKKSEGYGSGRDPLHNLRASEALGIDAWKGALLRLNDKIIRLNNYAQKGTLPYESAEDNLLDAAAYSILALVLLREKCQLTSKEPALMN